MSQDWVLVMEAIGASGLTGVVIAAMTVWGNRRGIQSPDPNGVRTRLQDEVTWLRQQLAIAQTRGFITTVEMERAKPDPAAPPPSSV